MIVSEIKTGIYWHWQMFRTLTQIILINLKLATQRNRALSDVYEPGSTFKIVAVSGCMNEGLVGPKEIIDCSVGTLSNWKQESTDYQVTTIHLVRLL